MEFQSTGLGKNHLDISWQGSANQLSIEEAHSVWEAVLRIVPSWLPGEKKEKVVVLRGKTRLPVVWQYFSAMDSDDFENILRVALSRPAIDYLTRFGERRKLSLILAIFAFKFFSSCVIAWLMRRGKGKNGKD